MLKVLNWVWCMNTELEQAGFLFLLSWCLFLFSLTSFKRNATNLFTMMLFVLRSDSVNLRSSAGVRNCCIIVN